MTDSLARSYRGHVGPPLLSCVSWQARPRDTRDGGCQLVPWTSKTLLIQTGWARPTPSARILRGGGGTAPNRPCRRRTEPQSRSAASTLHPILKRPTPRPPRGFKTHAAAGPGLSSAIGRGRQHLCPISLAPPEIRTWDWSARCVISAAVTSAVSGTPAS